MRRVYPQDVFPGVWGKVGDLSDAGIMVATELVLAELEGHDDDVYAWARVHREMFLPVDERIQLEALGILKATPKLIDLKKRKSGADPFVIACALTQGCAVVSEEDHSGGPHRPKIPDVCDRYDIECFRLLEVLRREGVRL